jgi:pilus assembly protein Flp/PilA
MNVEELVFELDCRQHAPKEEGQGLVEYALLIILVSIAIILVLSLFGDELAGVYSQIVSGLQITGAPVDTDAPQATCVLHDGNASDNWINAEASVTDPNGNETINRVDFFVDGNFVRTEYYYRYCLGCCGTPPDPCTDYNTGVLPPGQHTIRAVAYDDDGNTGECSITFTK